LSRDFIEPTKWRSFRSLQAGRGGCCRSRLEEFDTLVGNWLVENGNSISLCSVQHQQSAANPHWLMLSVMVTFWVPVAEQASEEEVRS
jgi:hypothetical protein